MTREKRWVIDREIWQRCMDLFPTWLRERGGIAVYENHMMDSSECGSTSFMPARFYAKEVEGLQDAPPRIGDVPSRFKERVDHIQLEEFGGDVQKCIDYCFVQEAVVVEPKETKKRKRK